MDEKDLDEKKENPAGIIQGPQPALVDFRHKRAVLATEL